MNWDSIGGRWTQFEDAARSEWDMLTGDDVASVAGRHDVLLGRLQERYGYAKERAERAIDAWLAKLEVVPQRGAHDDHLPRQRRNEMR